jgi:hypothetical protein
MEVEMTAGKIEQTVAQQMMSAERTSKLGTGLMVASIVSFAIAFVCLSQAFKHSHFEMGMRRGQMVKKVVYDATGIGCMAGFGTSMGAGVAMLFAGAHLGSKGVLAKKALQAAQQESGMELVPQQA